MKTLLLALATLVLAAPWAYAQDMTDSYVTLESPTAVVAGATGVEFTFYVYNGSPDFEWTYEVVFTFPSCFTVVEDSGSYLDGGLGWNFVFSAEGHVARFTDGDGGYGEIYDGDGGYFMLRVDVGEDCPSGQSVLHWLQQGDMYGGTPHFVEGTLDFAIAGTATETRTWSSVRSLY